MKKKLLALIALVMVLSLAACGGNAGSKGDMEISTDSAPQAKPVLPEDGADVNYAAGEMYPDAPMEGVDGGISFSNDYNGAPQNAKIIYTADMELETKEFEAATQAVADAVASAGGYFESRSVSQGGRYRSMSCTVRVPVENFRAFLEQAGEAAHVTSCSDYSDDVSEVYYDNEARLTTQRTKLERLQELLSKAEAMEDIITIESAISETELQIEYLTGSLRKYDSQINYSTVNLQLYEVYRLSTDEEVPQTFGERLGFAFVSGLQQGVENLEDFAIFIACNWLSLLVWAAVIAATVLALRKFRLRRKAVKLAAEVRQAAARYAKPSGEDAPAATTENKDE